MDENVFDKGTENPDKSVSDISGNTEKDPFGRIDFGKPLYQAAPPASDPAPEARGPMPLEGAGTPQPSGPSPMGGGAAEMSGPSPLGGAPQPGGISQPGGAMNPAGGPMMMQGGPVGPMGGPVPNGDGMFSPYGGPASQFGGTVPQPVEPVQFGGSYSQGGPQFQQGMGYQQVPPYQQPMGDMYYGYPDPYMQMQQNNGSMGLGIASMVLGILALVTCCCWYIAGPLAAISLILGIIGIKSESGKGMAIAGVVCSGVAILILVAIMAYSCYTYGTTVNSFWNILNNIP